MTTFTCSTCNVELPIEELSTHDCAELTPTDTLPERIDKLQAKLQKANNDLKALAKLIAQVSVRISRLEAQSSKED